MKNGSGRIACSNKVFAIASKKRHVCSSQLDHQVNQVGDVVPCVDRL